MALLTASCATDKPKDVVGWAGSQVFMLPQEGGFQQEILELKNGQFRYWFSSDVIDLNPTKYPIEGSYEIKGNQLVLSNGSTYTVRLLHGVRSFWRPGAVDYWDHHQIIDVYGILLPVKSIKSEKPKLEPLFEKAEWERSGEQVRLLEKQK
jgi:hypothetical protein